MHTKLEELYISRPFENWEALKLMPNVRSLKLSSVPRVLEKYHANLERVVLFLKNDGDVHSFSLFVRMNGTSNICTYMWTHTANGNIML